MKTPKLTRLGRLIPSIFLLLFISGCASVKPVIGVEETIVVHTRCGDFQLTIKADTGAKRCSIGEHLIDELCLIPSSETVTVRSASGKTDRPLVEIEYTLLGTRYNATCNIANREGLSYSDGILGGLDIEDYYVDTEGAYKEDSEEEEAEEN